MEDRTPTPVGGPAPDADDPLADVEAAQHTRELLAEHVPLALLVDLVGAQPPSSEELLATEGLPEEEWWEPTDGEDPAAG